MGASCRDWEWDFTVILNFMSISAALLLNWVVSVYFLHWLYVEWLYVDVF